MHYPLLLYRNEEFNPNFFYFSGSDIDHSFVLLFEDKKILFVPKMNERLACDSFHGEVVVYKDFWAELRKLVKGKRIFIDGSSLSARAYGKLRGFARPVDATEKLLEIRAKKKANEIEKMIVAAKATKNIIEDIDFSRHKTEDGIRRFLLKETMEQGYEPAFDPIVAADSNSIYPHYKTGNKRIGDVVIVDYGVRYQHYCADITRVFFLKSNKEMTTQYDQLQMITHEIMDEMPAFKNSAQLAAFAQKRFKKYKLPALPHSIGHGIGLDVHEYPRLSAKYKDRLAGTSFTLEPALYLDDYGLRFEETVYFDGKKAMIL